MSMGTTDPGMGENHLGKLDDLGEVIYIVIVPLISGFLGLFTAAYLAYFRVVKADKGNAEMVKIADAIKVGAKTFLHREYMYIGIYVCLMLILIGVVTVPEDVLKTLLSFVIGAILSGICGYIGMLIAVEANVRTANAAIKGLNDALVVSFASGGVMGLSVVSITSLGLVMIYSIWQGLDQVETRYLAGFGFGASSIALFARVGGGIYTKAADVGADLVGKVEANIPEDDPKNPATIADNVGDNVGDVAGMGADLFGSFAESSCAALVIAAQTGAISSDDGNEAIWENWGYVSFPLVISCTGIVACFLTSFVATSISHMELNQVEPKLKGQIMISTIIETILLFVVSMTLMPEQAHFAGYVVSNADGDYTEESILVKNYYLFFSAAVGLWAGLGIGYVTEYYTSNQHRPTQVVAENCRTGAATNVIMGLALGYKSVIFPACAMAVAAYVSHSLAGFYGVSLAALGILSTLSIGLTIDAFGPISDNAGGIAEMSGMAEVVRERTDCLDAAGNTTAAIGKGFAIGSAAFVSLALFSGYMTILQSRDVSKFSHVDILHAFPFAGLLVGAMIPYWFSAMTMSAVGRAAHDMVVHVRQEFEQHKDILQPDPDTGMTRSPDYSECIRISTEASLKEMIPPGALVMGTPLFVGFVFGCKALAGVLIGALVSGVCGAISASNTGGAWDNAKKYIEQNKLKDRNDNILGKNTEAHKAAVVGDTIGDPLKDTSGPSLNIVMKLMAVESLVFAKAFYIDNPGFLGWIGAKIKGN